MAFLDTNILLYSISRAPHERAKREVAIALLNRDDCTLSVQVLQTYYVQATRASRVDPLHAAADIAGCREIHTEDMTHGRTVENIILTNPFL